MDTQIQRSNSSSGGGVHVCRKCGWPFPKPRPSSRHRRAHKKVCGSIEGYSRVGYGDEVVSDDDSKGETLTDGLKSVEKSTRRGGSEEELFADAVTEFAGVNVAIEDAGNLFPPSSANGAQVLTPEREGVGIDTPLQQNLSSSSVDSVPSTGSDPKEGESSDCKSEEVADEKLFGSVGDVNEETGRRLETFTSCNDRFQDMVEPDCLLLRGNSAVVLEGYVDQKTEIGETADNSEALLRGPKSAEELPAEKKGEEAQQKVILTDASARNFLDDVDSLAKSIKGVRPDDATNVAKEELTLTSENSSAADNEVRGGEVENLSEFPVVLLESKDAIQIESSVLKSLQESEAGDNAISGTEDNVDSKRGGDLDEGEQGETVAEVGIRVDSDSLKCADVGSNGESHLIEEKGLGFGFVDGDMNLLKENLSESALGIPVDSSESKDTIPVEINIQKCLQESEAANNAISGTAGNVDSDTAKQADVGSNGGVRLIEGKGLGFGFVDGDMNLLRENLSESALGIPVDSSESKDTIPTENDVQKSLQESEAANNAISGTAGNVDSDTAKRADVGSNGEARLIEEKGLGFGFVDGDMNLPRENLSESALGIPVDSSESKDTIPAENDVQKSLRESEAADNAVSGIAGDVDSTQSLAITEERDLDHGKREETVAETRSIEENEGMISGPTDGGVNLMKEEKTVSTSVSAAAETKSLPPQAPATVQTPIFPPGSDNDKQETSIVKPNEDESGRKQGPAEPQTPQIPQPPASGSPGSKKNEEIGAEKRHMPLKSFLGDESSPPRNTPAKEMGQEWNSPARYPTNIKREKRKGRSRGWVPFICCSSAQPS